MTGDVHGGGHVLRGGGMNGRVACVAGGVHGRMGSMHGRGHACHTCLAPKLRDMVGQCAGGISPTGMHSCNVIMFALKSYFH